MHGNLWAMLGIGGIIEYDPRGVILGYVPLPNGDRSGTNLAFGAPITSTSIEGAISGIIWRFMAPYPGLIGPGGVRLPAQ